MVEKQSSYKVTTAPGSGCSPQVGKGPTDLHKGTRPGFRRVRPAPAEGPYKYECVSDLAASGGGKSQATRFLGFRPCPARLLVALFVGSPWQLGSGLLSAVGMGEVLGRSWKIGQVVWWVFLVDGADVLPKPHS